MTEPTTVTGYDAIDALVSNSLGEDFEVTEHKCGIDIDNAARAYDREASTDYEHVMWVVLLYSDLRKLEGTGATVEDLFTAKVVQGERNGCTDSRVLTFSIHEDIFDCESRGTHYEFFYPSKEA
ncbi:hypothetical protein SEA_JEEVES_95 [Mycobacterium phage Jeeves]|uniref:Uncharacterized protein n=1 Tax=Mycobacterium phage Jeeves TaxID=2652402 RepID=A0A5J6T578_9CAUD|nr:hypothetical protein KNU75_gp014 [Mycobacterium phage Jeeves]QFG04570.1 hypothetical protein SEA_JEEVES_95 [Mycobacterium phage Jeeves]